MKRFHDEIKKEGTELMTNKIINKIIKLSPVIVGFAIGFTSNRLEVLIDNIIPHNNWSWSIRFILIAISAIIYFTLSKRFSNNKA